MLQAIAHAETAGVPAVWLTTGSGPDGLTVLAGAATRRPLRMGTVIVPTFPRHPVVIAQQTADIAQLAPGRFVLGLGPSHSTLIEGRYGIPYRQPLGHLLGALRCCLPLEILRAASLAPRRDLGQILYQAVQSRWKSGSGRTGRALE